MQLRSREQQRSAKKFLTTFLIRSRSFCAVVQQSPKSFLVDRELIQVPSGSEEFAEEFVVSLEYILLRMVQRSVVRKNSLKNKR